MKKILSSLGESLFEKGLIDRNQLVQIESEMEKTQESFQKVLRRLHLIDEKEWIPFLSEHFKIPAVQVTHQIVKPDVLKLIPADFARKFCLFPLMKVGKRLSVAMSDPFNLNVIDQLRLKTGLDVELMLAAETEIRSAIEQNYGSKSDMSDVVQALKVDSEISEQAARKHAASKNEVIAEEAPTIKLVNLMIAQAIRDGASDIHVAPEKDKVLVRYRVDGVLREMEQYAKTFHAGITSRIKVIANLDITENRIPQDGRARFEWEDQIVDLRISVMPTVHGENLVIRVLNTKSALMPLSGLGMADEHLRAFKEIIAKPYGMLLITGPTGSGKTTTLYTALNQINGPERNIVTIEDPVEYQLPLIRQIQVNPKVNLTFANGLRSILRQDPDVIMVGEIRDKETASIAIQAALTGHMVFSTLHTNNAASAVTRLLDMGIEPFLVSSTLVGIIAQRLVRAICKECRESYQVNASDLASLKPLFPNSSSEAFRGKGCLHCKKTGYRGRSGLFEVLIPDEVIRQSIVKQSSSEEIEKTAVKNGMKTLRVDGLVKIKSGVTTIEEVLRVTQE